MSVVIDTNIILSSLIKDSITREIIIKSGLNFYYPEISFHEVEKYAGIVIRKSGMTKKEYGRVLNVLMDKINLVSEKQFTQRLKEADRILGKIDKDDVVFLACALALNIGIWSDDKDFQKQKKVGIFTTRDMINRFFKKKFN